MLNPEGPRRKGKQHVVIARDGREWILAIDTATDQAGIALFDGERLFERSWPGSRQQTVTVLPQIDLLLAEAGIGLSQVGLVAVTIGPGSFTGLRVGLSIAKGIVIAESCAIVGLPTLDVAAEPHLRAGSRCVVVSPAGRGRVIWAAYGLDDARSSPENSSFDAFVGQLDQYRDWLVVAELTSEQRGVLQEAGAKLAPLATSFRRAGMLAEMGQARWERGQVDDPVLLEPAYLHGRPNPR
jgi:tRNA threonylcarbamoyladenosine biosynthesis protein TsaB